MIKTKVCLFKSKSLSDGSYPILIRISYKKERRYISTGYSAFENQWDVKSNSFDESFKDHSRLFQKYNLEIIKKVVKIKEAIASFDPLKAPFDDLISILKPNQSLVNNDFISFFNSKIEEQKTLKRFGNAQIYNSSLCSFKRFIEKEELPFNKVTYRLLSEFQNYLIVNGNKKNTISVYLRTIRAIFNKAIKEGFVSQDLYPFKDFQIKSEKTIKRSIVKSNITTIKELDFSKKPDLEKARDLFLFSFYTRGMSFVDIANLKVSNIIDDRITYTRNKTKQKFTIKLTPQISEIIIKYNDLKVKDSYLFPIITDPFGDIYTQYRNGIRLTNKKLHKIGKDLKLNVPLTTYVSRHSWATIAKREGVPTAVISEGLGHETERTTQIYLDSFENQVLDDANDLITNI
jgi:integrase